MMQGQWEVPITSKTNFLFAVYEWNVTIVTGIWIDQRNEVIPVLFQHIRKIKPPAIQFQTEGRISLIITPIIGHQNKTRRTDA